jgi:hypothetical protein
LQMFGVFVLTCLSYFSMWYERYFLLLCFPTNRNVVIYNTQKYFI